MLYQTGRPCERQGTPPARGDTRTGQDRTEVERLERAGPTNETRQEHPERAGGCGASRSWRRTLRLATFGLSVGGLLATLLDTRARQDYAVDLLHQEVHDLRNLIAEQQGRIDTFVTGDWNTRGEDRRSQEQGGRRLRARNGARSNRRSTAPGGRAVRAAACCRKRNEPAGSDE